MGHDNSSFNEPENARFAAKVAWLSAPTTDWKETLQDYLNFCLEGDSTQFNLEHLRQHLAVHAPPEFAESVFELIQSASFLNADDCQTIEPELSAFLDSELDEDLEQRTILHLASCNDCMAILADLKSLSAALIEVPYNDLAMPSDFAAAVMSRALTEAESTTESTTPDSSDAAVEELVNNAPAPEPVRNEPMLRIEPAATTSAAPMIWPRRFLQTAAAVLVVATLGLGVAPVGEFLTLFGGRSDMVAKVSPASDVKMSSKLSDEEAFKQARDLARSGLIEKDSKGQGSIAMAPGAGKPANKKPLVSQPAQPESLASGRSAKSFQFKDQQNLGINIVDGVVEIELATPDLSQTNQDLNAVIAQLKLNDSISSQSNQQIDFSLNFSQASQLLAGLDQHPRLQTQFNAFNQRMRFRSNSSFGQSEEIATNASSNVAPPAKPKANEPTTVYNPAKELKEAQAKRGGSNDTSNAAPDADSPTNQTAKKKQVRGRRAIGNTDKAKSKPEPAREEQVWKPETKSAESVKGDAASKTEIAADSADDKQVESLDGIGDIQLDRLILKSGRELNGVILGEDNEFLVFLLLHEQEAGLIFIARNEIAEIRRSPDLNSQEKQQKLRIKLKQR